MTAIIIITFNTSDFLEKQIELYNHFIGSRIIVIDNSSDYTISKEIRKICKHEDIEFIKTGICEGDSSKSHGFALNFAYNMFKDEFDIIMFSDHDMFPIKSLDLEKFMENSILAGIPQLRENYKYFWPGLIMINNEFIEGLDFMPITVNGINLDTGGATWEILSKTTHYIDLREVYEGFEGETYSVIEDTFLHFVNGSNWKQEENHEERINKLFKALESKL